MSCAGRKVCGGLESAARLHGCFPGQHSQLQSLLQDVLLRLEDINNELDNNDTHVDQLRLKVCHTAYRQATPSY